MKYRESKKDNKLRKIFSSDYSHALLRGIKLDKGSMRGLNPFNIGFKYPITAIAGRNGAGKSTVLAMACCAYHNKKEGYKLPKRNTTYYTYSDFFVQHKEELTPQGIYIYYRFAYDKWKKSEKYPDGKGLASQIRKKSDGGKWNDYAKRIKKNVVFLGIERIVPHSERSQSRSYSKAFRDETSKGWENKVKEAVGYILSKSYDEYRYLEYSKYSLPMVRVGDMVYSGFNMGAGENALFEIFSTIYSCGEGALIVIDEIELGLHVEAQRKFIDRLKDVCLETHSQIICTTHSKEIFECLPYDARLYIECVNGNTRIIEGMSSEYAFSKMAASSSDELDIYVEDDVVKLSILSLLNAELRTRVNVRSIGSATALARQLAALYVREEERPVLAIFDGDQKDKEHDNLSHAKKMAEKTDKNFDKWFLDHIEYFPGNTWPEAWIVNKGLECIDEISQLMRADSDLMIDTLKDGLNAGKHNEIYKISESMNVERTFCIRSLSSAVYNKFSDDFKLIMGHIEGRLNSKD